MDLALPLAKTGAISAATNMWLAIPIGVVFGYALFHAGFTDSRRIAWAFYFKDVGVPVVMFSAIVTGMLGLWGMSLAGWIDITEVYMLPTFLIPMAIGGLLFGIGMAAGGYCPGTAIAAVATGKIDGVVFIVGFLIGSLIFGDLFPIWGDFYNSNYLGAFRLDQWLQVSLGTMVLMVVVVAVAGTLGMRWVQYRFWPETRIVNPNQGSILKLEAGLVTAALLLALGFAFFPNEAFVGAEPEPSYYIVPRTAAVETP